MVEEIRDGFMEKSSVTTGSLNSKIDRRGQWRDERTMFNSHLPPPPRFFYLLCSASCGILVPHQGLNPCPLHWEHKSLNHWTTREVSERTMFKVMFKAN